MGSIMKSAAVFSMIGLSLATFLGWLDLTIVNTALPAMQTSFHVNDSILQWVMNALLLSLSAFMVIVGKLADRFGRRRLLYIGMLLLVLSSIGAALSQNFITLVIARFIQGISIGILYTAPMALVGSIWPERVNKAIGIMIGTGGFALAFGPVAGGILVTTFGWHAIFWINLPITLAAFLFCILGKLPASKVAITEKIDLPGAGLMALLLGLLIFTTANIHETPWMTNLFFYIIVAVLTVLFIWRENNTTAPIIDFHLFANQGFIVGVIANFFLAFFYCVQFFFIPLHLHALGYHSSMTIGFAMLPPSLMFAILSLYSGKIISSLGARNTMLLGYALFILSALLQILLNNSSSLDLLISTYLLFGIGWALVLPTSFSTALSSLPAEMGGVGMGSIGTIHNFGGTVGLALGSMLGYFGAMNLILATSILAFAVIIFVMSSASKIDH